MRALQFLTILTLACAPLAISAQPGTGWEFKGEKDGVKIYHQRSPGLLHIKATSSVKTRMSAIAALFADVDNYKDWGYKMLESRLLERVSETEHWYYVKYDFPWPFDDRDIILHSKLVQDPISRKIKITNTPHPQRLPENKGLVRIRNTTTQWVFTPGEGGWVYVEQYISTDSAEGLPEWLVKLTADTGPRETAKGVRRLLRLEKYQNARLAHILE